MFAFSSIDHWFYDLICYLPTCLYNNCSLSCDLFQSKSQGLNLSPQDDKLLQSVKINNVLSNTSKLLNMYPNDHCNGMYLNKTVRTSHTNQQFTKKSR